MQGQNRPSSCYSDSSSQLIMAAPNLFGIKLNAFSFVRTCLTAPASKRVQSHSDLISVFPPGRLLTGYLATFAVGSQGPSDDQTSSTSEYPLRPRTKRPKRSRSRNIVHNIIFWYLLYMYMWDINIFRYDMHTWVYIRCIHRLVCQF